MRRTLGDLTDEELTARDELTRAVRDLARAAGTTLADPELIDEATALLRRMTSHLDERRTERVTRAAFEEPGQWVRAGRTVPLYQLNPGLPPIEMHFEGDFERAIETGDVVGLAAWAEFNANALYEGPPDSVHGGVSSFLMDCMLGLLVQASGVAAVTGTLDLRYLRRTPLDEPFLMTSRIASRSGRKIRVTGTMEHGGEVSVEASGLFIAVERTMAPPPG